MMTDEIRALVQKLPGLIDDLKNQEQVLWSAIQAVTIERCQIQVLEDEALLSGMIDGRNEQTREAQVRKLTAGPRRRLIEAEKALSWERMKHTCILHELTALKILSRIVQGGAIDREGES